MTIKPFTFNPFMTNCYVCHSAGEAVLVDAASSAQEEHGEILDYIEEHDLALRHLLLTHGHLDHIFGCAFLADAFELGWQMHRDDLPMIERADAQSTAFGVPLEKPPAPTSFLAEGDVVRFGEAKWNVLHTPGHSRGSITFYDAEASAALAGDVLFHGSIGRVDLPGGSMPVLMESIFQKLVPLGDETAIHSGHGPSTTIGRERRMNPFLASEMSSRT